MNILDLHWPGESPLPDGTCSSERRGTGKFEPTGQSSGTQRSKSQVESGNKGHPSFGSHTPGKKTPPMLHAPTNDRATEWLWVQTARCFPGHMTVSKLLGLFKAHFPHLLKEVLGTIF